MNKFEDLTDSGQPIGYKILQEFPGSATVGTILDHKWNSEKKWVYFDENGKEWDYETLENNPEYFGKYLYTIDEVDVYVGDYFYIVLDDYTLETHEEPHLTDGDNTKFNAIHDYDTVMQYPDRLKLFSSKEKALEFIENNKCPFVKGDWLYSKYGSLENLGRFENIDDNIIRLSETYTYNKNLKAEMVWGRCEFQYNPLEWSKATTCDIERILRKVAEYKGFKTGVKFYGIKGSQSHLPIEIGKFNTINFDPVYKVLFCQNSWIYIDGEWGTIINPPERYVLLQDLPNYKAGTICQKGFLNSNNKIVNTSEIYPFINGNMIITGICKVNEISQKEFNKWFKLIT